MPGTWTSWRLEKRGWPFRSPALSANSITKLVLAWSGRHMKYGLSVRFGVVMIALAAWLGLLLS